MKRATRYLQIGFFLPSIRNALRLRYDEKCTVAIQSMTGMEWLIRDQASGVSTHGAERLLLFAVQWMSELMLRINLKCCPQFVVHEFYWQIW